MNDYLRYKTQRTHVYPDINLDDKYFDSRVSLKPYRQTLNFTHRVPVGTLGLSECGILNAWTDSRTFIYRQFVIAEVAPLTVLDPDVYTSLYHNHPFDSFKERSSEGRFKHFMKPQRQKLDGLVLTVD